MKRCKYALLAALLAPILGATCITPQEEFPDRISGASTQVDLTFTRPGSDRTVASGAVLNVEFLAANRTGSAGTLTIFVENRSNLEQSVLAENIAISGVGAATTVAWNTAGFPAAEYSIRGRINAAGKSQESTAAGRITIDGPPKFSFTAPAVETTLPASGDGTITIGWTIDDAEGGGKIRIGLDQNADHGSGDEIFIEERDLAAGENTQSFEWDGTDVNDDDVLPGLYHLFALVEDASNPLVTVEGLANVRVPEPVEPPDPPVQLGIITPSTPTEFVVNQPSLPIEFGVNDAQDVLVDLKIDADDNHTNGNEITILSQRFVEAGTEKESFSWDGRDSAGNPVPDGIYTLLVVVNRGSGAPQTVAATNQLIRRTTSARVASQQTWERAGDGGWTLLGPATQPPARTEAGAAYDARRSRNVLFGGRSPAGAALDDTWLFDRANWAEQMPTMRPSARWGHVMVFDAGLGETLVFGGTNGPSATVFGDTWIWDGADWAERVVTGGPSPRHGAAAAYDTDRAVIVLFGGTDNASTFDETWEWDGAAWTLLNPLAKPSPRTRSAIAYDQARGVTILFGGQLADTNLDQETWEYDGDTWTLRQPDVVPSLRHGHAMVFDEQQQKIVLFGGFTSSGAPAGDTWTWSGETWAQQTLSTRPAARDGHAMVYDVTGRRVFQVGGSTVVPVISLIQPAQNATVTAGQFQTITWRDDDPVGTSRVRLVLDDDGTPAEATETGAAEIEILASRDATPDGVQDTFAVQIPASLAPGTYYVFAYIDSAGDAPYESSAVAPGRFIIRDPNAN